MRNVLSPLQRENLIRREVHKMRDKEERCPTAALSFSKGTLPPAGGVFS
jgi:hypothetical protein